MRVLQLTSDWKWTGPAEPMLGLALELRARGIDVLLACPEAPEPRRSLASQARSVGLAPVLELSRGRGVRLGERRDVRRLRHTLETHGIDVVHCWHTRDHVLAWRAARRLRRAGRVSLVRSYRRAERIAGTPWNRWLFGPASDGLLCVSPESAPRNARLRRGRPLAGFFGAVDLERFRPEPAPPQLREALGLPREAPVVGIVARVQPQRRFDLLLEAASRLFARLPEARLLVVGRGTHRERVAEEPARRLGIADRVVFAGYRREDYRAVLHCIDVFTFLVPGSDGTCRALLEAAACGLPAVTSRRGALPEIVADGETGLLVDEEPEALARAWERLARDAELRKRCGAAARRRAETHFRPDALAESVSDFYRSVREGAQPSGRPAGP